MIGAQIKSVQQQTNQISSFGSSCASIQVELIHDQVEDVGLGLPKPFPSEIEDSVVTGISFQQFISVPHEHRLKHAVVGNQDIWGCLLHLPTVQHL